MQCMAIEPMTEIAGYDTECVFTVKVWREDCPKGSFDLLGDGPNDDGNDGDVKSVLPDVSVDHV